MTFDNNPWLLTSFLVHDFIKNLFVHNNYISYAAISIAIAKIKLLFALVVVIVVLVLVPILLFLIKIALFIIIRKSTRPKLIFKFQVCFVTSIFSALVAWN